VTFVGVDLGTTNSAIATFDGANVSLFKSPEQHDVTPSAIYVDRRGNRFVGSRAYNNSPRDPANAALLFKRWLGTSNKVRLPNLGRDLTPEECSAEILRTLFGYLPPELRSAQDIGTVITVPAAFDQMQKDATLAAAEMAQIGRVALMQEPVAAVMSVMRKRSSDGIFLIYDLGGGTLDIAVAQSIGASASLLAHGGISVCGGRDLDRAIVNTVVWPWLQDHFDLPADPETTDRLLRLCSWAAEKAKIELSQRDDCSIALSETDINLEDAQGNDLYIDAPLDRATMNELMAPLVAESVEAARSTLKKADLGPADVDRIVFVGGPTFYPALRDKVCVELGIAGSTEVNPMTAVAEGAALFAESIDWTSRSRGRKSSQGKVQSISSPIEFAFEARTPASSARLSIRGGPFPAGAEFQIDGAGDGWSSGRKPLREGAFIDVPLPIQGENLFRLAAFDPAGRNVPLPGETIAIVRTAATIDGIPASRTVSLETRESVGGGPSLTALVREGELLPKKGALRFIAGQELRPGDPGSLNFKLWEGENAAPSQNDFIGLFKIRGADLVDLPIKAGAELLLDYEMLDSGCIVLEVSVPGAGGSFQSGRNFYSRQEAQLDFASAGERLEEQWRQVDGRVSELAGLVPDAELEAARTKAKSAQALINGSHEPEDARKAADQLKQARSMVSEIRARHRAVIRQLELQDCADFFNQYLREAARPSECEAFDRLARTAELLIDDRSNRFEAVFEEMQARNASVLWRQDWFIEHRFRALADAPHLFIERAQHALIVSRGEAALAAGDFQKLRGFLGELLECQLAAPGREDYAALANIIQAR